MKTVDIIIPIYNAYEYTKDCILSVINNTNLKNNRLILINDSSPDDRIKPMINEYKNNNKKLNIEIIENESNLGFVKTVNKGINISKNDVVLLNSDTEVTSNWLEKMQKAAYSNKNIATVTPLSNNGGIVSVPNFIKDNVIPLGYNLEEYASLIEQISFKSYPQICTGVGFCLYIKREVIKEVGILDEIYGIGYGEETDFCYRCMDYGYIHVLDDSTFIYHKGTQSFKEKYDTIYDNNMKLLLSRYKKYNDNTNNFILNNPLKFIQDNIIINLYKNKRQNVLYTIHSWMDKNDITAIGGTSLHLYDIVSNLKYVQNSFVLESKDDGRYILHMYVDDYYSTINFKINSVPSKIHFFNNEYEKMIENIIKLCNINLIHVQHTIGHFLDIPYVAQKYNIPKFITLHDFYYFCPSIHLLYKMDKYCDNYKYTDKCQSCIASLSDVSNDIIDKFKKNHYEYLKMFDKIFTPSNDTRNRYLEIYKDLDIEVKEHGISLMKSDYTPVITKKLNIAFLGVIGKHKGLSILKEMVLAKHKNINIHLYGTTIDPYLLKNHKNYYYHGTYCKDDIQSLLIKDNINLVCLFSNWPETYSYTLSESIVTNIPVIAYDIGAIAERIKKHNCGIIIPLNSGAKEILPKVNETLKDKNSYDKLITNIKNVKIESSKEMAEYYQNKYDSFDNQTVVELNKSEKLDILLNKTNIYVNNNQEAIFKLNRYSRLINFYDKISKIFIIKVLINIYKKLKGSNNE